MNANEGQALHKAETQWFHIFKTMLESGDVALLGPHAFTVYATIKSHTNYSTGLAFPCLDTIAHKSGVSLSQVKRCLTQLEQLGYISKEKRGKANVYTLREKIQIADREGKPTAVATWDYLPGSVQHAVADLKNVLVTGDLAGARIVHIEKLTVNVTNLHDRAVNFNVQQLYSDLDKLPNEIGEKIKSAFESSQKKNR